MSTMSGATVPVEAIKACCDAFDEALRTQGVVVPEDRYSAENPEVVGLMAAAPLIVAAEWERRPKLSGDDRVSLGEALHALDLLDDEDLADVTFRAVEWFEQWLGARARELRGGD